jgi:hypothetical protein
VPGLPFALRGDELGRFDFRYSATGAHSIVGVTIQSGSTDDDGAVIVDGSGYEPGGSIMRECSSVPTSVGGGVGEAWDNFDFFGINDAGDVLVTGDTSANDSIDEYIFKNGHIILREGDTASGMALTGDIRNAAMNGQGDWAAVWNVVTPGGALQALLVNGEVMLLSGDAVDWNGDGMIDGADLGSTLSTFTGYQTLAVGDRAPDGTFGVYFTADVEPGQRGTRPIVEGGFRLTVPGPGGCGVLMLCGLVAVHRRRAA